MKRPNLWRLGAVLVLFAGAAPAQAQTSPLYDAVRDAGASRSSATGLGAAMRASMQQDKLTATGAVGGDRFGYSVSLDGDRALVGALNDAGAGTNSGSAYVFVRSGNAWVQEDKIVATDAAAFDQFGISVALSGDRAIVGAFRDDDEGTDSGSAYVFVRSGTEWTQEDKLTATDAAGGDRFGIAVALSGDRALIGAYFDADAGTQSGSAYVFARSETGGVSTWAQEAKLTAADPAGGDRFGFSVSLLGDRALVGAYQDSDGGSSSGSAYVFARQSDDTWMQEAKLTAGADAAGGDHFGISVSLSDDRALVGARFDDDGGTDSGSAYVFVRQSDDTWMQEARLVATDPEGGDLFGRSVSLSGDRALVGAYQEDAAGSQSGSAYVFVRQSDATWAQEEKLVATDAAAGDNLGFSVSLDGDRALVGADLNDDAGTDSGSAYVFGPPVPPVVFGPQTDFTRGLTGPAGIAQLIDGRVLLTESFDNSSSRVVAVPVGGGAPSIFGTGLLRPRRLTRLADGRVLVADRFSNRVVEYPASGGTGATFANGLQGPTDVIELTDGRILVVEFDGDRVSVYPSSGGTRSTFASGLSRPSGVVQLTDGRILITEFNGDRVLAYPASGGAPSVFADGLEGPSGVVQLDDRRVLVVDFRSGFVWVYPASGGAPSLFAAGLSSPQDVKQLADGRVLVTDSGNGRLLQFAPTDEAVAITEARFFNPSTAQSDGAGYRMLGAPVAGFDVTDLAARNLVQGVAAGSNPATHPAQYENAGANLFTGYTGSGAYTVPDADDVLVPGRGFLWNVYDLDVDPADVPASFGTGTSGSTELTDFTLAAFGAQAEADVMLDFADNAGDDFHMIANPFARPLNVAGITAAGGTLQGGVVQIYNADGGGFVVRMGADRLGTWQGAFAELVPTTAGDAVTLTYAFASTDGDPSPVFVGRPASTEARTVRFALNGTLASGASVQDDAAIVRFSDAAEAGWDALDASKITPPNAMRAMVAPTLMRDGAPYRAAVDSRPVASASVPLSLSASEAGAFTLSWAADLPEEWTATITDTQTGASLDVRRSSETTFTTSEALDWTARFTLAVSPRGTVANEDGTEARFDLAAPRPNPARGASLLSFSLAEAETVRLSVIDLLGREVAVLVDGERAAGAQTETLDASALAPGVYVVRLVSGVEARTQRLVVVR